MVWFNAESVLLLLKQEPEVAHLAGVYLKWASIGLPAYGYNCILRFVYRPSKRLSLSHCKVDACYTFQSILSITRSVIDYRLHPRISHACLPIGLFNVPTRIILFVAPVNAALNWLLGP